jgi:hypothetical protein
LFLWRPDKLPASQVSQITFAQTFETLVSNKLFIRSELAESNRDCEIIGNLVENKTESIKFSDWFWLKFQTQLAIDHLGGSRSWEEDRIELTCEESVDLFKFFDILLGCKRFREL